MAEIWGPVLFGGMTAAAPGKAGSMNWGVLSGDRIPSTTPGAEPPRDAKDSGSARSHSPHLETSSPNRP